MNADMKVRKGDFEMIKARHCQLFMAALLVIAAVLAGCQSCQRPCPSDCTGADCSCKSAVTASDTPAASGSYAKPGFLAFEENDRLWVLRPGEEKSEKHITLVGAGPNRMTIKALDKTTAIEYIASKPGFDVLADEDGRIWVYRAGETKERPEKHITLVGAGPLGSTIKCADRETLDAYMAR
jgi:hypothetical protein